MRIPGQTLLRTLTALSLLALVLAISASAAAQVSPPSSWTGVLRDEVRNPVVKAMIQLHSATTNRDYNAQTSANGTFAFHDVPAGTYELSVSSNEKTCHAAAPVEIKDTPLAASLQLCSAQSPLRPIPAGDSSPQSAGGEHLSSEQVSSLPLNARDFSKLLLLAAGTMTDANGAANFTQQFAVNGQRGNTTIFAIDGADTTDPEMGGATFSNFNVDAIQEVQGNAGVMQAEIGHGAASYTNVVTKSGTDQIHGSVFEFVRNAAFDARNYFDYKDPTGKRRIPPFVRNEFGFTNGGPVVIPHLYDGRNRTFYFGEYQGFRQVLGTTQVIPVPTADERQGIDTLTFPGDTLTVPVNPAALPILNQYPLPNQPTGAFGDRTYATSSKIVTRTDQFSVRIDQ